MTRIALIHALKESIHPIHAAFDSHWPEATCMDLLDTSLSTDLAAAGNLDSSMIQRFRDLGQYAAGTTGQGGQTQAILFTCSAFGRAIDAVKADHVIPVLHPNEAAFAKALTLGRRLALVVTFPPSLTALQAELETMAIQAGKQIDVTPILVEGALAALKAGDSAGHDSAVLRACDDLTDVDAIILGQFSLARASGPLAQGLDIPIVTTPDSAVVALKSRLIHP